MKAMSRLATVLISVSLMVSLCSAQPNADSLLAERAYKSLKKANVLNGITISLGLASNIEMAAIGGFPLEVDDGMNPGLNLSHMVFGVGRLATSAFPAFGVRKARKMLEPWRNAPEMATSCEKLFANLNAAQILSAAAPVLCFAGGMMMLVASTTSEYYYEYHGNEYEKVSLSKTGLKTAGWVCVGAGLVSSFSSAILVSIAKKDLAEKIGTFKMTGGTAGIGVQYNLPVK